MSEPTRPSLPPLLWFGLAMWAGAVAGEAWDWSRLAAAPARGFEIALAAMAALFLVLLSRRSSRLLALLLACGALAGALAYGTHAAFLDGAVARASTAQQAEWRGAVVSDPVPGRFGNRVRVRLIGPPCDGLAVSLSLPRDAEPPGLGRLVRFRAHLKPIDPAEDWARDARRRGERASARPWTCEIGGWRSGPLGDLLKWRAGTASRVERVRGPGGDLLAGILLGDRRRVADTALAEDFRTLGLSHILAVSGDHLALAFAAALALARRGRAPHRLQIALAFAGGSAFAVVTGLQMSALRALAMSGIGCAAGIVGRRRDPVASLAAAIVVVIAVDPGAAFDLGFQLSVAAVGGLVVYGDLAVHWFTAAMERFPKIAATFAMTTIAQVVTWPLVVDKFHMFSLMAPVANLLVLPFIPAALYLGMGGALGSAVHPAFGRVLLSAAGALLALSGRVAAALASVPGAAVPVADGSAASAFVGLLLVGAWAFWPVPRRRREARLVLAGFLGVAGLMWLGLPRPPGATLTVLDVGQADAILYRDGGKTMLVDAGAAESDLRAALARHDVRRIDVLVLTHAHDDHIGGLGGLTGTARVAWVGVPAVDETEAFSGARERVRRMPPRGKVPWIPLNAGAGWTLGETRVRVLWPSADAENLETNDTSVIMHLSRGSFDAVLTGDAEARPQHELALAGGLRQVEVLKVPHHGSRNGLTEEALAVWRPGQALISVGEGNDFGHPSPETLELLDRYRIARLRTDEAGDIVVRIGANAYRVATQRRVGSRSSIGSTACASWATRRPSYERISWRATSAPHLVSESHREQHVRQRPLRPEARLPHLRLGRAVAQQRGPPPPRAARGGCGPGLQLRRLRR